MSVYVLRSAIASRAQYEPMVIPCRDDLIGFTFSDIIIREKRGDLESAGQFAQLNEFQGREELESGVQIAHL